MSASSTKIFRTTLLFWILSHYAVLTSSSNKTIAYPMALNETISNRIIGGDFVSIRGAPFVVNLRLNGRFMCGGSLLRPNCVLTAAHCVIGTAANRFTVQGGTTILSNRGQISRVQSIFIPKSYKYRTNNFDVAILRLTNPLSGKRVKTVDLANDNVRPGQRIRVYGWGLRREDGSKNALALRAVTVRVIRRGECSRDYRAEAISNTMFCASIPGRSDSCSGDSGGPLMFRGRQYGIVSWGAGCGRPNYPGVNTSIRAVQAWINQTVAKNCQ